MKRFVMMAAILVAAEVSAQNLNSTVEVTNDYVKDFSNARRNTLPMAIPDTLLQFDRNFDYSVFDKAFEGSYEFVPFSVKILPQKGDYGARRFYLCAGAGYTMHPVLNAVYSPLFKKKGRFGINVFQRGNGYWGEYRGGIGTGYDLSEEFGTDFRYSADGCTLTGEVAYDALFRGALDVQSLNGVRASLRLASVDAQMKHFTYDIRAGYSFASTCGASQITENDFDIKGTVCPKWGKSWGLPIDFDFSFNNLGVFLPSVTPHIQLKAGPVDIKAGVALAWLPSSAFRIYPDVYAKWDVVSKYLTLYACAVGKAEQLSYSSLMHRNHFSTTLTPFVNDCTSDFYAGLRGAAGSVFQWELSGGYAFWDSMTMDVLTLTNLPGFASTKCRVAHADLRAALTTSPFDAEVALHYRKTVNQYNPGCFALPELCGEARLTYNWMRRVLAGIWVEGASKRLSATDSLPGYVNLGAMFEYRYNRSLSFWLQGANLLDKEILRTPVYAEKGINFTAGICLNF